MTRLIDADALGELVSHGLVHYEDIMAQPTVDAVPVIRCKDCKWYYIGGAKCMYWDGANSGDDFCSRAERKEE